MKSSDFGWLALAAVVVFASGCGNGAGSSPDAGGGAEQVSSTANGVSLPAISGANVMQMTVNGSLCASDSYSNKPCVTVTICSPQQTNCQTITDILLDTGSYGLRVFKSVLSPALASSLQQLTSGTQSVAECVQFGDGSSDWGPVEKASVTLGGESPVQVPIQVIDSTFGALPSECSNADETPSDAGFSGILGVGLFAQDCGETCESSSQNEMYFGCIGTNCTGLAVTSQQQVTNPVALLPRDNNGVVIELPTIPTGGVPYVNGYVVLGIGTETNNTPIGVSMYSADPSSGEFTTRFNGLSYQSFLDTGSNALYFSAPSSVPDCGTYDGEDYSAWWCPSSTESLSASNIGSNGEASSLVSFQLGNFLNLALSDNNVFVELGGDGNGTQFDWGLPFYFGRNVYVGLEGASSSLGSGPYWAY